MTYTINGKIGADLSGVSSTSGDTLGNSYDANDGSKWVFVQANGELLEGNYVCIDESFQAVKGTKALVDDGHDVGFAQTDFTDNQYGYVMVKGRPQVKTLTLCAADVALYTTATAGALDDTATSAQTKINGVVLVTANGTGTGNSTAIASWPRSTSL
jgi:hypothetical protein